MKQKIKTLLLFYKDKQGLAIWKEETIILYLVSLKELSCFSECVILSDFGGTPKSSVYVLLEGAIKISKGKKQ